MNTERTKLWRADFGLLPDDCSEMGQTLAFVHSTTLQNPRASRGFFRCADRCQSPPRIAAVTCLVVPEGRRRKLAGGKPAPAGAAPGIHAERTMPQRGIVEAFWAGRSAVSSPPPVCSGRSGRRRWSGIPAHFFDAPLGHRATRHGYRGRRPLLRTCPRLISCGVSPGRELGDHALKRETGDLGVVFEARSVAAPSPCATTLQNPRAPGRFRRAGGPRPQRPLACGGARNSQRPGSDVAAATGDRSRAASVAASPSCVHRISVVISESATA